MRDDRFASAASSGADLVFLDLEDAVDPASKDLARDRVIRWLAAGGTGAVRINARSTPWFEEDLATVALTGASVVVPKIECPDDVKAVRSALSPDTPIIGLIETPASLVELRSIVRAPGLTRLAFGNVDLAAALGIDAADRDAMLSARSALVVACAYGALPPPLDGVTTFIDEDRTADDARYGCRLGFGGKLCIHPRQVDCVNKAFTPTAAEANAARTIVNAYHGGVMVIDGRMVDEPVAARARRILERIPFEIRS